MPHHCAGPPGAGLRVLCGQQGGTWGRPPGYDQLPQPLSPAQVAEVPVSSTSRGIRPSAGVQRLEKYSSFPPTSPAGRPVASGPLMHAEQAEPRGPELSRAGCFLTREPEEVTMCLCVCARGGGGGGRAGARAGEAWGQCKHLPGPGCLCALPSRR